MILANSISWHVRIKGVCIDFSSLECILKSELADSQLRRPVGKLLLNCCSLIHVWKCRGPPLSIQFSPRSVSGMNHSSHFHQSQSHWAMFSLKKAIYFFDKNLKCLLTYYLLFNEIVLKFWWKSWFAVFFHEWNN